VIYKAAFAARLELSLEMIRICQLVFKDARNRPIITPCYSSQGIATYVVFYVGFGGGQHIILYVYTKQLFAEVFLKHR
jgi:hypothetical protein